MSDLGKIATAEPVILTDGISQQVALTTALPASSAVGMAVREVSQGQQTAANSHPVVLASDQSPIAVSGTVVTSNPSPVANGQANGVITDKIGRLVVVASHARELVVTANVNLTTTTETTLFAAGGAGVFLDLTQLIITNDGSNAVNVTIRDATAGTVRAVFAVGKITIPANIQANFTPPWPQTTANNNWTVQLSASVSTVHIFAMAVKNV